MGKATYSHHISYGSNGRPTSVTTTNKSTGSTTTRRVGGGGGGGGGGSSSNNTTYKYNATTGYYEPTGGSSSNNTTYKYNTTTGYYEPTGGSSSNNTTYKYNTTTGYYEPTGGSSSNNYASKYANNSTYQSLVKKYGASNVGSALDYMTSGGKVDKSQLNSILSGNTKYSNPTSSVSGGASGSNNFTDNYTAASLSNYNNAINHMKSKGMSEADAKSAASGLLEKQNLLDNKTEEEKAAEMGPTNNQEEEERDAMDTINEVIDDGEEYEDYYPDYDDLIGDWADRYEKRIADLESQLNSNTVKKTIPEERDTSYDYNTYFKENLAPDNNYENGVSKNTLNDKPQVTLVSQYQEPVTTALNDLGLLTPNEEAATSIPDTEEQPSEPKTYNNGEEIVSEFNNTLEQLGQEGGTGLTPQAAAQTYMEYKNKLDSYVNNNRISPEEYKRLLDGLRQNELLNKIIRK